MFNPGFYPTPPSVAAKMLEPFSREFLQGAYILEPSAGKGDLAEAIRAAGGQKIDCVEVEQELGMICEGKGFTTYQGVDFLQAGHLPTANYDLVVMNPPFDAGADHLLWAWNITICPIVCLLNAETLSNPYSAKRQLLAKLIEDHGSVENLGACFDSEEAFRKTKVEVVLVRLSKENAFKKATVDFTDSGFDKDPEVDFAQPDLENQLERPDAVAGLVLRHKKCLALFESIAKQVKELDFYSQGISLWEAVEWPLRLLCGSGGGTAPGSYSRFAEEFKKLSWDNLFTMTKYKSLASRQVKRDFEAFCKENRDMAFTEQNISRVLDGLFASRGNIMRQCVVDAFDLMTAYHEQNRVHVEGWKTNDAWRVNRKVILPNVIDTSYDMVRICHYNSSDRLDDIDRAMGFLTGRNLEKIKTIAQAFRDHEKTAKTEWNQKPFESDFFECRAYKKGTLHIFFKDEALWERFNVEAARGKNWLPDDYKERAKAADKYAVVPVSRPVNL